MIRWTIEKFRPVGRLLPQGVKRKLVLRYLSWESRKAQTSLKQQNGAPNAGMIAAGDFSPPMPSAPENPRFHSGGEVEVDLVISPNEISFAHGTGVLLSRLVEDHADIVVMRSRTDYGGQQRVKAKAAFVLPLGMTERRDIFAHVLDWLSGYKIRSILCAPYFSTDLVLALAAKSITAAPLGLWIMDDNCLNGGTISRELMAEAIDRADALFAISPELKRTYQTEFRKPMSVLPPLVAPSLVRARASAAPKDQRLLMIGNVWSADILDRLSMVVQEAGLKIDWYSPNPSLWSGQLDAGTLRQRGISIIDSDDPKIVSAAVKGASAVIVPSDPGNSGVHETALGAMSLPTRMPFVVATAGTPLIVVSQPGTAAAAFVERFNLGRVVPYNAAALAKAVAELANAAEQNAIRKRAAALGPRFSFAGAREFVFSTIQNGGRWPDDRYDSLLPVSSSNYGIFQQKPAGSHFSRDFGEVVNLCDRLLQTGFTPDFIMDIGASTGIWSLAASSVFDKSRYVLCDPMFSRYGQLWTKPGFELVEAAIGDKPGEAVFSVSSDLYGSSLINVSGVVSVVDSVKVKIRTVDDIAREKKMSGRGLIKIDVQYAEHLVIEGALKTLQDKADIVILELTLARAHPQAKTLLEVANRMDALGFRIFDQVGGWRLPASGEMEQLDLAFVRKNAGFAIADVAQENKPVKSRSKIGA